MADLLLSICIPTNGAVEWILPTLESIYSQNIDIDKFEVVITDNGENSTLESTLSMFQYCNLRYIKNKNEGFLNLVTSLQEGRGVLRKMLNHRSLMLPGSINRWLEIADTYKNNKPIIYFSDSQLHQGSIIECSNEDEFVKNLTFLCSWSAGISIWDVDADNLERVKLDKMFPNTSILFSIRENSSYVIVDEKYQCMQNEMGKGGYPLYHTFAVTFLDLLTELRYSGRISLDTFIKVKSELFCFLCDWFVILKLEKNKYTFTVENVRKALSIYYSNSDYYRFFLCGYYQYIIVKMKRIIKIVIGM